MTKIKICGLSRIKDIEAVNQILPDYIGFVFAQSKRRVNLKTAKQLKDVLDKRIQAIGVFVNESHEQITELCGRGIIDMVQLHGDEDEGYIRKLKEQISAPVIKAVRVQSTGQIINAQKIPCDYLLLDTYQKDVYGGSGKRFDWSLIPEGIKPFFLAGGIDLKNAHDALTQSHPYCLDVSSGVETGGLKDAQKIKEIVQIVRSESK